MEKNNGPFSTREEELKAENALLRLKLETDFQMLASDGQCLSPEMENRWLSYVYEYERQHRRGGKIKIIDFIGSPVFQHCNELDPSRMPVALERLIRILNSKGIFVDWSLSCDIEQKYRFVTEELFEFEIDNVHIQGMQHHFTYENFHMNTETELKKIAEGLIQSIYGHHWKAEFDSIWLAEAVYCQGKLLSTRRLVEAIDDFTKTHSHLSVISLEFGDVLIDKSELRAEVHVKINYRAQLTNEPRVEYVGTGTLIFVKDENFWQITGLNLPGIGPVDQSAL